MPTSKKQKQVRFAETSPERTTVHSPLRFTPALTSASSVPSSTGPITPPHMSHVLPGPSSPYTISYVSQFPAKSPHCVGPLRRVRPHPLLESAAVSWDLMEYPSTISLNNHLLSSRLLVEQATIPRLPALSIISIHLPWIIDVRASNGSYVTLGDMFDSVYISLGTNINENEFNLLHNRKDKMRATRAYEERYRRFRSISHDEEKRRGMKRIDFLMGHTWFHSISNTGRCSDEWQLNVSSSPPSLNNVKSNTRPFQVQSSSSQGLLHTSLRSVVSMLVPFMMMG